MLVAAVFQTRGTPGTVPVEHRVHAQLSDHTLPPVGEAAVLASPVARIMHESSCSTWSLACYPTLSRSTLSSPSSTPQCDVQHTWAFIPHLAIKQHNAACCCQVAGHGLVGMQHAATSTAVYTPSYMWNSMCCPCGPTFSRCCCWCCCCMIRFCYWLHRHWSYRGGGRCAGVAKVHVLLDSTLAVAGSVYVPLGSDCALLRGNDAVLCHCY
jgi:hypothetical protein